MEKTDPQSRLDTLRSEIRFHNYRYNVVNEPVISDSEYDRLMRELREILGKRIK